jgi:hypothetical protein
MAQNKRRTKTELLFFSGRKTPDPSVDTCTADQMPCPSRISENKTMKQLWDFIVADMENRKCLSPTYTLLISELVEVMNTIHVCRKEIDKEGLVVHKYSEEGSFLGSFPSAYQAVLSKQQSILLKLMEKIGMSPRDITYLVNPEATATTIIEQRNSEMKGISYFR